MKTIRCLQDLLENGTLREWQKVIIDGIEYKVTSMFLNTNGNNDKIFHELYLYRLRLAEKCYGYKSGTGMWPESKMNDYEALTRLVAALYVHSGEFVKPKQDEIEITVKINGKEAPISTLSDETILNIKHSLRD